MANQISLPDKIKIEDKKDNRYEVIIEPFYPGFGVTVGNALRRVLLSSLAGAAVTSFKIDGVQHEFDTINGVKEDVVEIMLNLKKLRIKLFSDEPVKLQLSAKGEKVLTAGDIAKNADVEVANTDLVIATLTDKSSNVNMEITVEQGLGYVTVEQREKEKMEIGTILVDSSFSPVLNVGFDVSHVRVGKMTNYEKLTFDILTDGTVTAEEAIVKASATLASHFDLWSGDRTMPEVAEEENEDTSKTEDEEDPSANAQDEDKK
ncbi:DNA-directed RNA polymerase subunit alpha [bacterium]|nr:DNA-directed RNA polymerase subunit alpha [bacterium]MBT4648829.1 DNA-directed RNA polymerase subunit alpha [bacterium]